MAQKIDEQIVKMLFDNSQFESEAQKTISTLGRLKQTTEDFGQDAYAMDPLINALAAVGGKFSALETIATGALLRIGYQLEATGEKLVKNLTIDQVTAGWSKYEEKTRAVQTIMSATGDSIDTVNEYLDKLMWYTDETSYNFVDMTSNIGKFTAQGVKLEDATTAMMGISNWAAQSGQGINEASRAMYNLSQALGTGKVMLRDWMSVENANMGTKEFKEQAIETAIALGTLSESAADAKGEIVTFANFRDTLQTGWFTNDVLIETLKQYGDYSEEVFKMVQEEGILASEAMDKLSDSYEGIGKAAFEAAQVSKTFKDSIDATVDAVSSGWLTTFEHLFGNLETQKVVWTQVTEVLWELFAASGEARNELLQSWEEMGGQLVFLDALGLVLDGIVGVMNLIGTAWRKAFPPMAAETLYNLTVNLRNFLGSLELTEYASENITDAIGGVLSVFRALGQVATAVARGLFPGISTLNDFAGTVVGIAGSIGRSLSNFADMIATEEHLAAVTETVSAVVGGLSGIFTSLVEAITGFDVNSDGVVSSFSGVFTSVLDAIKESLNSSGSLLEAFGDVFQSIVDKIRNGLGSLLDNQGATDFLNSLGDVINTSSTEMIKAVPVLSTFISALGELIDVLSRGLVEVFGNISGTINWDQIFGIAELVALAALLTQINRLNPLEPITGILQGIKSTIDQFKFKLFVDSMKSFAEAIAILAGALVLLGTLPIGNALVATGILVGIGFGLKKFIDYLKEIDPKEFKSLKAVGPALIAVSASLAILAGAVTSIGSLDLPNMIIATAALGVIMLELQKFSSVMSEVKFEEGTASKLLAMVAAIDLIVPAVRLLGGMNLSEAIVGLSALGGVLLEVSMFAKSMESVKIEVGTATSLIAIAAAIDMLAVAVAGLGLMSFEGIAKGLIAIAGLLAEIGVFSAAMQSVSMSSSVVAIIGLATAIDLLTPALIMLGGLQLSEIGRALVAVGGALTEMVAAMGLLQFVGPQAVAAAAGLTALSVAILALTPAIVTLGALPTDVIIQGLVAVAATIGIFVAAAYLLTPIAPMLVGLSASFALVATGAAAIIAALALLSGSLLKAAAAFILFGSMSQDTVQNACDNIILILDNLVMWIIKNYVKFKLASLTMFAAFIDALVELTPSIVNGVLSILNDILQALVEWGPELFQGLIDLLDVLDEYMEPLGTKAIELMDHFLKGLIKGLADGIGEVINNVIDAGKRIWNSFKNALFGSGEESVESTGKKMAEDAAKGLDLGAKSRQKLAARAGSNTAQAYLDGFDKTADRHSPWGTTEKRGEEANQGLANGVNKSLFKVKDAATESAGGFLSSLGEALFGSKNEKSKGGAVEEVGKKTGDTFASSVEKTGAGKTAAKTVAKQLTEDQSLEKAAKEKAQKVADAFTTEFNKISSQLSAIGSKFGIAEAYLGPEDDEGKIAKQKQIMELQRLQEELKVLATKYNISWDQYQNLLTNPEATNEEVQKQYADYLSVYEEMAKKALDISTKQKELYSEYQVADELVMEEMRNLMAAQASLVSDSKIEASQATQEAYNNFLQATTSEQKQYYHDLWQQMQKVDAEKVFGDLIAKPIDKEAVKKEVYTQLGLDPNNPIASFMSVEDLINQAVAASQQTYLTAVEETYPSIIQAYETKLAGSGDEVLEFVEKEVSPKFARSGVAMAESTAEGMESASPKVSYAGQDISISAATATKSTTPSWQEVGIGMMDGIIQGIEDRRAEVIEAAIEVALAALAAAKNALGIASPSKAFLAVGMFAIDGLRIGIQNSKDEVVDATTNVADEMITPFDTVNARISHILDDSLHPVIDPTLDLTGVKRAAKSIDNLWSSSTLRTLGDISLSELSRRDEIMAARTPVAPVVETTNNFTQNNYSPKALSDAEIYRQTKKEIDWAFKGAKR